MFFRLRKALSKNVSTTRAVEKSMPWLWKLRRHKHISDASPIVVGGCPRSGTTLLRMMLDSHSNICCGPETRIFCGKRLKIARLSHKCDMQPAQIADLLWISRSRYEFIELFFDAYKNSTGKRRWAEKTPKNLFALDNVFRHFSKARFIHVLRDGRDVVCSLRTHPKFALKKGKLVPNSIQRSPQRCAEIWKRSVTEGVKWRGDKRYREVKYEDLVRAPEETLRALLDWLGEPWDPAVLSFYEVKTPSRQPEKNVGNPEANRPVDAQSTGRWRKNLNASERLTVNSVCGELLKDLGYCPDVSWLDESI